MPGDILPLMSNAAAIREHDETTTGDSIVVLRHASWDDYERLLEMRGDHSAPLISYLEGEVEIMSPSRDHEGIKSLIARLLEVWCVDRGIHLKPFGSWTVKEKAKEAGVEPDECYIFGKEKRDRPHLAIEVEWTRRGIHKLAVYEKLGIEEVWWWRKGAIKVYVLTAGKLVPADRSRRLPDLDLALLASMLDRDSLTDAVVDFRKALGQP